MTPIQDTGLLPVTQEALKPCPFCGGPGTLLRTAVDGSTHIVGCTDCSCCIGIQTASEAVAAWNARAEQPKPSGEPVAWMYERNDGEHRFVELNRWGVISSEGPLGYTKTPLYAALSERGAVGEEVERLRDVLGRLFNICDRNPHAQSVIRAALSSIQGAVTNSSGLADTPAERG